jgi:hypothetical protein
MKDILNENLMAVLFKLQPPKSCVTADYTVPLSAVAYCGGSTCTKACGNNCVARCPGGCLGTCSRSCQGKSR